MLAEEVTTLTPYGPGTVEERADNVSAVKTQLRAHASNVFGWLSHLCTSTDSSGSSNGNSGAQQQLPPNLSVPVIHCFNAWVKLGSLHDAGLSQCQPLVALALNHLRDPQSPAFEASGEALCEVVDHCPDDWLDALHEPMVALGDVAANAAAANMPAAAEAICKVVAPFATMRINMEAPGGTPSSAALRDALLRLAALPQINPEGGDPVCWPALAAWASMGETLMGLEVGGYDVFDDQEFYGQADAGANGSGAQHGSAAGGGDGNGFVSASSMCQQQEAAQAAAPAEVKALFEQLYVALLKNLVSWLRPEGPGHGGSGADDAEVPAECFTPTFTAGLADCLSVVCNVISPHRFTGLLWMMLERPSNPAVAPLEAAAAMHAVAAAGGQRLTSDPAALEVLSAVMLRAAELPVQSDGALLQFCCAAAATSRQVLVALHRGGRQQEATAFLGGAFGKAMQGLAHPDHDLDVHTPSALAVKALMQGAQEVELAAPPACIHALVGALQAQTAHDAAAEQALVVALAAAVATHKEAATRRSIELECYQQLVGRLHGSLSTTNSALGQGRSWGSVAAGSEGADIAGGLRRYALLLQHAWQQEQQQQQQAGQSQGAGTGSSSGQDSESGASWLVRVFLQTLWPALAALLAAGADGSALMAPLTRALALLARLQPPGVREVLPSMLETLVNATFRPGGKHVHEVLTAIMEAYSGEGSMLQLVHTALQHLLSAPPVSAMCEMGGGDKDPELAECVLKVATGYMRHSAACVAAQSGEAAVALVGAVIKVSSAVTCCNHRAASSAALQCTAAVVAAATTSATSAPQAAQPHLVQAVLSNGPLIVTGLVGGLLAPSPLSRLHKVIACLTDLAALVATPAGAACLQQHEGGGAGASSVPPQGAPADALTQWLAAAARAFQLSSEEQQAMMQNWTPAAVEAASAARLGSREQAVAGRQLKKLLRDFAESHGRVAG